MRIGRLGSSDLSAALREFPAATERAEIFHRKQDKYSTYGRCADCDFLGECSVCPISIGHVPGNDDPDRVPDFACAFNLALGRQRRRFAEAIAATIHGGQ
jgi:hypothetical protein